MKNQGKTVHNVQLIFRGSNEEGLWFQSSLNFFHTKQKSDYKCISFLDMQNMYIFFFKIAQNFSLINAGWDYYFLHLSSWFISICIFKKKQKKANTWYKKWRKFRGKWCVGMYNIDLKSFLTLFLRIKYYYTSIFKLSIIVTNLL